MLSLLQIRPGESRKALLLILLMLIPSAGSAISSPGIEALAFFIMILLIRPLVGRGQHQAVA